MNNEEKLSLIKRGLDEILTEAELKGLLESDTPLKHYIGFEISGKLHIGHFFQLKKVKDLQDVGAQTTIWLADYHSAVNDKLDGNIETIKRIANDYFVPAMKTLFECLGGQPDKLIFKLCSEEYAAKPDFWMTFLEMAKGTSLSRSKRSITIMGREEAEDSIETAKIMYPIMQAADIFLLQANIAQAGMDQRKVHVVARDSALQIKTNSLRDRNGNQIKPVAIHTPILLGLTQQEVDTTNMEADELAMKLKMSKSKTGSSISVHDSPEEIKEKINGAFAPEGVVENNPVLNWVRHLIFHEPTTFVVKRDEKWGGELTYNSYEDLERDYTEKKLHPMDLKVAVADWLIQILEPARKYFEDPARKAALEEVERLSAK